MNPFCNFIKFYFSKGLQFMKMESNKRLLLDLDLRMHFPWLFASNSLMRSQKRLHWKLNYCASDKEEDDNDVDDGPRFLSGSLFSLTSILFHLLGKWLDRAYRQGILKCCSSLSYEVCAKKLWMEDSSLRGAMTVWCDVVKVCMGDIFWSGKKLEKRQLLTTFLSKSIPHNCA